MIGRVCGVGMYERPYIQCHGGYQPINYTEDVYACKSFEMWNQFAKEACANYCAESEFLPNPIIPVMPETAVSAPIKNPTPVTTQTTPATLSPIKCGVNASSVYNE